jgi:hypothetical protein
MDRISRSLWPVGSPEFTQCDLYLPANFKHKIDITNSHTEDDLKEHMQREILDVPEEELRVNCSLFKQYWKCVLVKGQYFKHVL